MLEERIGLDPSLAQTLTLSLLAETAFVAVVASPVVGHVADRTAHKKQLLLGSLGVALLSSIGLALSESGMPGPTMAWWLLVWLQR